MALQDEQQIRTASSDNHSLVTVNIHSDRLPRSNLQPTALDAAALQEKYPIEQQKFKMQVLKQPKCGPTWNGLEEQGDQVGSPDRAQSSSTPTVSSHQQQKALGSPCFSCLSSFRIFVIYHSSLISLYLCLQMLISVAGAFQVEGPCVPLVVRPGGEAKLRCSLWPPQNVGNMQITWTKSPHHQVVHLYKDGSDKPQKASPKYFGRTKLVRNATDNSTVTLKICNVQSSDSGQYRCAFQHGSDYNDTMIELRVEGAAYFSKLAISFIVLVVIVLLILFLIGCKKRNELKSWCKNRSSKSQPSPSQAIQHPYVPAPNTDPEDDELHSVATNGSADTSTTTVDTHDAIPGETSTNPTEDPYPSGTTTVNTLLTADSESANAYDSKAHDSTYCDSYDSASPDAEACGSAHAALLAAEDKNELLSKYDSQKQVEMQVFAVNWQVYNPEYH
ncbi:uncharacterized protein LOC123805284 isoform X2 [Phyllostomus hastatus]|uniref:uncharacterized protein LOC123805284 isoform X2 n=1 Tax=Phyllostomus hastatus TaxID=9423 RepID=UPI001E681D01|nr:uncharacterized protein LOC123805284 isoform X2 [Phyllostomus hastatus]